jgi:predicted SAM-dependent methyltransferase
MSVGEEYSDVNNTTTVSLQKPTENGSELSKRGHQVSVRDYRIVRWARRFRPLSSMIKTAVRCTSLPIRPIVVSRYLRAHSIRKLQIGSHVCVLPGWLNSDLYPLSISSIALDATKTFPLPTGSFDYVFSEHQFEHIAYEQGVAMLGECRRILRPGGKIRLALPSLDRMVELFQPARTDFQDKYIRYMTNLSWPTVQDPIPCFAMNSAFMDWGHRFIYDRATLRKTLEMAGFDRVQFFTPGISDDPNLTGIEARTRDMDLYETMVAQAVRNGD